MEGYSSEGRVERRSDDLKRSKAIEKANGRHLWRNRFAVGKGTFNRALDLYNDPLALERYENNYDSIFGAYCEDCRRCHKGGCNA